MKAIWNGAVVAESADTVIVEGNHYFPMDSVNQTILRESPSSSFCGWKGTAAYYNLEVDGETLADAAFHYPEPFEKAQMIAGRVAFWKGVSIQP